MKPWEALVVPLIQLPIFVSFYIGIGKMGLYCPGFEHGGLYWFTDLGAPGRLIPLSLLLSFLLRSKSTINDTAELYPTIHQHINLL
jgi:membrane protein insertase Oxa1/YidC/SpoIIIJ